MGPGEKSSGPFCIDSATNFPYIHGMATGYTHQLLKNPNMTFQEFALICSRAMGALVMMRDDDSDAPIPTSFKPSDFHVKSLRSVHGKMGRLTQLTGSQKENFARKNILRDIKYHLEAIEEAKVAAKVYTRMLNEVQKWNAPSKDHEGMKKFMEEQITSSIGYDADPKYHYEALAKYAKFTSKNWMKEYRAKLQWELDYHTKEQKQEVERANVRTKWIQNLFTSIGLPTNVDFIDPKTLKATKPAKENPLD